MLLSYHPTAQAPFLFAHLDSTYFVLDRRDLGDCVVLCCPPGV